MSGVTPEEGFPSLNALRSFAVAARCLSFTRAARELHVTQGAVSRMVRELERDLGVRLFRRVGRSLELTPVGVSYYTKLAHAFESIGNATRSVRGLDGANVLSINAPASFAMRWLVPRLQGFRQAYPDILVDVATKDGSIDFSAERVDVAVVYGPGKWEGVEAVFLMSEEMGVFCAPELLACGVPFHAPSDLHRHCLLHNSTRSHAWAQFAAAFNLTIEENARIAVFEHFFMVVEAAAAGMGAALLPLYLARDEVRSGRLVQPFPQTLRPPEAYYVIHAPERAGVRKIRIFKKWLIEEVKRG